MNTDSGLVFAPTLPYGRLCVDLKAARFKTLTCEDWADFTSIRAGKHSTEGWGTLVFTDSHTQKTQKITVTRSGAESVMAALTGEGA